MYALIGYVGSDIRLKTDWDRLKVNLEKPVKCLGWHSKINSVHTMEY